MLVRANVFANLLSAADARAASLGWKLWLRDGAAGAGGRAIRRWSRTPIGWDPSPLVLEPGSDDAIATTDDGANVAAGSLK